MSLMAARALRRKLAISPRPRLAIVDYFLRLIACFLVLCVNFSLFGDSGRTWLLVYTLGQFLIYPHLTFYFGRTPQSERRNILLDTFLYSTFFPIWGFNPYLVMAFAVGITITNLTVGGLKFLALSVPFSLVGIALGLFFNGVYFLPELPTSTLVILSVGFYVYIFSLGLLAYRVTRKLMRMRRDLHRQKEQLLGINSLAQAVNSVLDMDYIMEHVFRVIRKKYAFDRLYLLIVGDDGNTVSTIKGYGKQLTQDEQAKINQLQCTIDGNATSVFVMPLLSQKPVYLPEIASDQLALADPFDQAFYRITPSVTMAVFPLQVRKKVIGSVALTSREHPVLLEDEDLEYMETIFYQVGTAVNNARTYERAQEASERAIRAQQAAERSEASKSHFLANMSHEIRTPMTSIIGYAEALLDDDLAEAEKKRFVGTIIRSGHHLLSVINDILDLSKIDADKLETENLAISLPQLIDDLQSSIGLKVREKGLGFSVSTMFPLPEVFYSDPTRLKQIMFNLTNNSVKFTARGEIALNVFYDQTNRTLVFEISDTGIGMTQDQVRNLFQPFSQADSSTTRQYGGTGLGLYISLQLARLLGGTIRVKSEFGRGTTFSVSIDPGDLADANWITDAEGWASSMAAVQQFDPSLPVPALAGHVLVAEDNPDNQRLVQRLLGQCGVEIDVVSNGRQAVDKVKSHNYDLVLLDIQMPVLSGADAASEIRSFNPDIPLVAFTANVMQHQLDEYIQRGFRGFIAKPISRREFFRTITPFLKPAEKKPRGKVLVAEDNPVNSKLILRVIKKLAPEAHITHVENGADALRVAQEQQFDLILMDMEMPRMRGDEALNALRQNGDTTPVVMFTGNVDLSHQQRFVALGAQGCLAKPINKEKLAEVLNNYLK